MDWTWSYSQWMKESRATGMTLWRLAAMELKWQKCPTVDDHAMPHVFLLSKKQLVVAKFVSHL